jgi:hypothetical protein
MPLENNNYVFELIKNIHNTENSLEFTTAISLKSGKENFAAYYFNHT